MKHRPSPRQQRRAKKHQPKPLKNQQVRILNGQRRLPDDFPNATKNSLIVPDSETVRQTIDGIERSDVLKALSGRLRTHPGRKSGLPLEALLVAMTVCLRDHHSARKNDYCAVLNGFNANDAHRLGLCDHRQRSIVSYHTVVKQSRRLEAALQETWVDSNGEIFDEQWFMRSLTAATRAVAAAAKTGALALDSTFVEAWATSRLHGSEKEFRAARAAGSLPLVPGGVGDTGPDDRTIRSNYDRDARLGHRSATNKQKAGFGFGYDLHLACTVREATWAGDPTKVKLGDNPGPYIVAGSLVAAGTDPGPVGTAVVKQAGWLAPVDEVIADRGYTPLRERFLRPLHKQNINVIMDHKVNTVSKAQAATIGKTAQTVLIHCGTIFPSWMPPHLHQPPKGLTGKKLCDWYDKRAKYRWSLTTKRPGGGGRFNCPQCAGRIDTNAKTRNPKAKPAQTPLFVSLLTATEYCCEGPVNLSAAQLDHFQNVPFGTTAWKQTYSRRSQIENINGILKNKGALKAGWCRSRNRAAYALATTLLCFAHNLTVDNAGP